MGRWVTSARIEWAFIAVIDGFFLFLLAIISYSYHHTDTLPWTSYQSVIESVEQIILQWIETPGFGIWESLGYVGLLIIFLGPFAAFKLAGSDWSVNLTQRFVATISPDKPLGPSSQARVRTESSSSANAEPLSNPSFISSTSQEVRHQMSPHPQKPNIVISQTVKPPGLAIDGRDPVAPKLTREEGDETPPTSSRNPIEEKERELSDRMSEIADAKREIATITARIETSVNGTRPELTLELDNPVATARATIAHAKDRERSIEQAILDAKAAADEESSSIVDNDK